MVVKFPLMAAEACGPWTRIPVPTAWIEFESAADPPIVADTSVVPALSRSIPMPTSEM